MHPIEVLGNVLLFTLVFAMSATVDINCMKEQLKNKKAILLGVFCQFLLLPFLGFVTVNLLNLSAPIGITLLVVTSSPGGSYSNWCDRIESLRYCIVS
jgi:predicted Na+-dependent transporter